MAMTLEQLVARVRETVGANLVGVVLYGSAAGRDYHDVPPFRGVYAGGGAQELAVTVEVTRQA